MKNKKSSYLIKGGLTALIGILLLAFSPEKKFISGETRTPGNFSKVSLAISANVTIVQGSQCKIEIDADEDDLEKIETEISNETLNIKTKSWSGINHNVTIKITMPDLKGISVAGSGKVSSDTQFKSNDLKLAVSGSGNIVLTDNGAESIDAVITGSGNIHLKGGKFANELKVTITGSGSYSSIGMQVSNASVTITGSGSAKVDVTGELKTYITGSGNVYYQGNPMVNANSTGSGKTKKM